MSGIDEQLHDYLIEHLEEITNEWLTFREEREGSIYSIDADQSTEKQLREQNRLTNITIASSLLQDQDEFENNKKNWAIIVAESRVNSNTPIHEVLEALSHVRYTFWVFVQRFATIQGTDVTQEDIIRWGNVIHIAFDELNVQFAEMYHAIINNRFMAQQNLIEELGTPVIKIDSSVGIVPLIGDIDTRRAQGFLDYLPNKCVMAGVRHLFIDLSGVSIIDTMVAHQIYQITQILKLLGIRSTITGIRPEIAQTAIQLGLDFSQVDTFSSLQLALSKRYLVATE
ncbi:STAS domain-containing protein [Sporosarcina sp. 179-K 3D1 HS]|uniref:STAS domain-containing protein n=1 Tax=Sporosarcina sp. 179-K 3D1 HS TaxID=3232169 RepID=UPI0039A1D80A